MAGSGVGRRNQIESTRDARDELVFPCKSTRVSWWVRERRAFLATVDLNYN